MSALRVYGTSDFNRKLPTGIYAGFKRIIGSTEFAFKQNSKVEPQISKDRDTGGMVTALIASRQPTDFTWGNQDLSQDTLSMAAMGDVETVSATSGTVTAATVIAKKGFLVPLGVMNLTEGSVIVTNTGATITYAEGLDYEIDYCTCKEIVLTEDGIYNFQFQNGEENSNMIVIVDCNWKACMLEYIKKFACTKVAACSCGGNCTNNCTSVPHDMYDFNAFSVLSWAYGSLINTEYLNNYIYAVLEPNKLDELFVLSTFLNRAKEYCAKCATATTGSSSSSGCGCKKV